MEIITRTETLLHLRERPWFIWMFCAIGFVGALIYITRLLQTEHRRRLLFLAAAGMLCPSAVGFYFLGTIKHVVVDKRTGDLYLYETRWFSSPIREQHVPLGALRNIRMHRFSKGSVEIMLDLTDGTEIRLVPTGLDLFTNRQATAQTLHSFLDGAAQLTSSGG